jgi:starvation-inducible DNA-binding protein
MSVTPASPPAARLAAASIDALGAALRPLLADAFALYLKTKNFHWHVRGPHFHDYHLLFDEQAGELLAMTDDLAERARKLGAATLRSIGDIARHQRLADSDEPDLTAARMLAELRDDNDRLASYLREAHEVCDRHGDIATASLIENWVDQTERRSWFLRDTALSN